MAKEKEMGLTRDKAQRATMYKGLVLLETSH